MKIAFVTTTPSININNWSGTEYYIAKALEHNFDVDYITDIKMNITPLVRLKKLLYRRGKEYLLTRNPEITKDYAKQAMARIKPSADIIFSPSTIPLAHIKTNKPKVFYTDATFKYILNFHKDQGGICNKSIKEGIELEKKALDSCHLAIFSSEWAAQSAINDYRMDPNKIKVVPFGANIDNELSEEEIIELIRHRDLKTCNIVFIGTNWKEKGGDIVLETVKLLNEMGQHTILHIIGIQNLPFGSLPDYVVNHGFIDKADANNMKRIEHLIQQSHFLFVPSRMEAYGIVFCEAMAFGVPCISSETGGIPTIIKNEQNGLLLPFEAQPKEYAEKIANLFKDNTRYFEMALNAYHNYTSRLSWDVAAETISKYIHQL